VSVKDRSLDCKEGVYKISLGQFHRQMLELAATSIENTPRAERYILGHTAAISCDDLDQVKEILDEALKKIEALGAKSKSGRHEVYHIELAAFPLTRTEKEIEDEAKP
jgi:uncharacterized protein (TIGR02147 family)